MREKHSAIFGLRVITALTILAGLAGLVGGVVSGERIQLFVGVNVPAWALGASVTYLGLRYWRRIPELQKGLQGSGGFAWRNLKVWK